MDGLIINRIEVDFSEFKEKVLAEMRQIKNISLKKGGMMKEFWNSLNDYFENTACSAEEILEFYYFSLRQAKNNSWGFPYLEYLNEYREFY